MNNEPLTTANMKLNTIEPDGFCSEPRILSKEVFDLRREVAAMHEALLKLLEVLQQKSEPLITKEAAS